MNRLELKRRLARLETAVPGVSRSAVFEEIENMAEGDLDLFIANLLIAGGRPDDPEVGAAWDIATAVGGSIDGLTEHQLAKLTAWIEDSNEEGR